MCWHKFCRGDKDAHMHAFVPCKGTFWLNVFCICTLDLAGLAHCLVDHSQLDRLAALVHSLVDHPQLDRLAALVHCLVDHLIGWLVWFIVWYIIFS